MDNKQLKIKILNWLCKKRGIKNFSVSLLDCFKQKFMVYAEIDPFSSSFYLISSQTGFYRKSMVFIGTSPLYVSRFDKRFDKIEIFDSIIEGAKNNDIIIGIDYKFLKHGTTYEQLAIEADLDCWSYL